MKAHITYTDGIAVAHAIAPGLDSETFTDFVEEVQRAREADSLICWMDAAGGANAIPARSIIRVRVESD